MHLTSGNAWIPLLTNKQNSLLKLSFMMTLPQMAPKRSSKNMPLGIPESLFLYFRKKINIQKAFVDFLHDSIIRVVAAGILRSVKGMITGLILCNFKNRLISLR